MPQIVWVALPDGLNIYLNQQWVNYTGLSLKKVMVMDGLNLFILTKKVH
jgi:PAS domain-containing protein